MSFQGQQVGDKGCFLQIGAGTITPPNGAKITAISIHATAVITNYKYKPKSSNSTLSQITVTTGKGWIGVPLVPSLATAFIPLGNHADSMVVASGSVMAYFD